MKLDTSTVKRAARLLVVAAAAALGAGGALAEKPPWVGGHDKGRAEGPPGQMKKQRADGPSGQMRHQDERQDRWQSDDRHRPRADRHGPVARPPAVAVRPGSYFNDGQRGHVHQWYGEQYRAGHCPPGLAKKNNGCMPPGQAKKWRVGYALPAGVTYYAVPQPVLLQLGTPPAGYRYVRVANDILLMAIGSRMVVDAITNLGMF